MNEKLETYLQKHYTEKTAKGYQRAIEIYLTNHEHAQDYEHTQIVNYIGTLRKKYTNSKTISTIIAGIKAYYSFLSYSQIRPDNPAKSIRLRDQQNRDIQLQDLFTTEELEDLLSAKKERYPALDNRNKVLISLCMYQALKPQEMEAVDIENIDLKEGTIYIKASAKTNARELSLKPKQIMLFHEYMSETRTKLLQENNHKSLLIGLRGEVMTAEDITKHLKRAYKTHFTPRNINAQTIRQSVITNLLKAGHDLRVVQVFAGHKYPSTTEKYKQTNLEALKSAIERCHPMK